MTILNKFQFRRPPASRSSDLAAIDAFAASKALRVISVTENGNHWYYWLRGKLLLSNLARIFVVVGEAVDGSRRQIHVAFDPLSSSKELKVLLERALA